MVLIIVVSHGKMAHSLVESAEMIVGEIKDVQAVALEKEDHPEALTERLEEIFQAKKPGNGVLVLADLPGATPFNVAAVLANKNPDVRVVSGVNLPMFIEVVLLREGMTVDDLEVKAAESGKMGIKTLTELLGK
jgi:mannose/fructose/sorbose-specific phosphotransferase system IIA component